MLADKLVAARHERLKPGDHPRRVLGVDKLEMIAAWQPACARHRVGAVDPAKILVGVDDLIRHIAVPDPDHAGGTQRLREPVLGRIAPRRLALQGRFQGANPGQRA